MSINPLFIVDYENDYKKNPVHLLHRIHDLKKG